MLWFFGLKGQRSRSQGQWVHFHINDQYFYVNAHLTDNSNTAYSCLFAVVPLRNSRLINLLTASFLYMATERRLAIAHGSSEATTLREPVMCNWADLKPLNMFLSSSW